MEFDLTQDEIKSIRKLKALAKTWPDSLWLFAANGSLHVMRTKPDGSRATLKDDSIGIGMDQDYIVETIHGISVDGGDW
jgi:hypothetical protein